MTAGRKQYAEHTKTRISDGGSAAAQSPSRPGDRRREIRRDGRLGSLGADSLEFADRRADPAQGAGPPGQRRRALVPAMRGAVRPCVASVDRRHRERRLLADVVCRAAAGAAAYSAGERRPASSRWMGTPSQVRRGDTQHGRGIVHDECCAAVVRHRRSTRRSVLPERDSAVGDVTGSADVVAELRGFHGRQRDCANWCSTPPARSPRTSHRGRVQAARRAGSGGAMEVR